MAQLSVKNLPKDPEFLALFVQKLMERIHAEYEIKSSGGTDSAGIKWKPLSPQTAAYRDVRRGDIGKLGIGGRKERTFKRRTRGLLTEPQDKKWRGIFAGVFERLSAELGAAEARSRAAQIAWSILKAEGAQTKLSTLGTRDLPIMDNTGRLKQAFSPGSVEGGSYTPPNGDQLVIQTRDSIIIKFNVPYADEALRDRPVVPEDLESWAAEAVGETILELYLA